MFQTGARLAAFGSDLRDTLGLARAVETGTFRGDTAVALSGVFPEVITVELAPALHAAARERLAREAPNVRAVLGDSGEVLAKLAPCPAGTLYFLDGHWSTGPTAGVARECPVMDELRGLANGSDMDCVVIDDARLFAAAPPPPHNPSHWPTLMELLDALREQHPRHHLTLVADQIVAVPFPAKPAVDRYARANGSWSAAAMQLVHRASAKARMTLSS